MHEGTSRLQTPELNTYGVAIFSGFPRHKGKALPTVQSRVTAKKTGCFKIRLNSKDNFSAFSETEFPKIVNTWSKWYSSRNA